MKKKHVQSIYKKLREKKLGVSERMLQAQLVFKSYLKTYPSLFLIIPSCQAMATISAQKPDWVLADFSQNINRMPVVSDDEQKMFCVT